MLYANGQRDESLDIAVSGNGLWLLTVVYDRGLWFRLFDDRTRDVTGDGVPAATAITQCTGYDTLLTLVSVVGISNSNAQAMPG
jgi:hypothetical protein